MEQGPAVALKVVSQIFPPNKKQARKESPDPVQGSREDSNAGKG